MGFGSIAWCLQGILGKALDLFPGVCRLDARPSVDAVILYSINISHVAIGTLKPQTRDQLVCVSD